MKTILRLLTIGATLALLAFPVAANSLSTDTVAQDQCTDENKAAWYATFRETFKTDQQPKAYEAAKKYLTACASEDTQITQYLKKWVTAYEKEMRKVKFQQLLYTDKNYPEAFKLGREILTDEPDNVKILMDLGYAGYVNLSNKNSSFNADAITYARKAIQLIESGKSLESWTPFPNKDEALAFLTYYLGLTTLLQDPAGSLPLLIKAAKFESSLKKSPFTYDKIATAYEAGPYAKLSDEYKTKFGGKDESPEQKLALENINQIVDRMIDAYARAVATAGADPKFTAEKKGWSDSLTQWYKYRNKSEAGLPEMVAGILAKPLPPEPTPLTSLPVSAPAATPAAGNGAATTSTTGTATPGTNTASNSGAPTSPKPVTTPAATSTTAPAKPGPKRPQRR
ncbi:MAG TPA: hypothetical protein VLA93_21290 [Pyrinomonadaceae bacterium]|nr:hypothetical protein [Pyrinomonadaceae bacterium]